MENVDFSIKKRNTRLDHVVVIQSNFGFLKHHVTCIIFIRVNALSVRASHLISHFISKMVTQIN